ncbi:MAG TPA: DinB family protein [Longimicrobiales bacterium]|nr:DinB family protein [Longimicrobiales bacterium]
MTTATRPALGKIDPAVFTRILDEGYGTGAWHGPDFAAALADVTAETAFERPAAGRHSIAEIALHQAWCARAVIGQLTGQAPDPFPLPGEDWFELEPSGELSWPEVLEVVEAQQKKLATTVAKIGSDRRPSPLTEAERFDLVLGITCHAIYHAGQVQLVKRLLSS